MKIELKCTLCGNDKKREFTRVWDWHDDLNRYGISYESDHVHAAWRCDLCGTMTERYHDDI